MKDLFAAIGVFALCVIIGVLIAYTVKMYPIIAGCVWLGIIGIIFIYGLYQVIKLGVLE